MPYYDVKILGLHDGKKKTTRTVKVVSSSCQEAEQEALRLSPKDSEVVETSREGENISRNWRRE